jgi:hypothetical protein
MEEVMTEEGVRTGAGEERNEGAEERDRTRRCMGRVEGRKGEKEEGGRGEDFRGSMLKNPAESGGDFLQMVSRHRRNINVSPS